MTYRLYDDNDNLIREGELANGLEFELENGGVSWMEIQVAPNMWIDINQLCSESGDCSETVVRVHPEALKRAAT